MTAVIVTRGDVDLTQILASLPPDWPVVVWDNSVQEDHGVYGRYVGIAKAKTDVVFVQDDDVVLPAQSFQALRDAYTPGVLTVNMPEPFRAHYTDSCLVGFGAIFDQDLPDRAFDKIPIPWPSNVRRECDAYFTALTGRHFWMDLPYRNLPWADGPDRLYRQPEHVAERFKALDYARSIR